MSTRLGLRMLLLLSPLVASCGGAPTTQDAGANGTAAATGAKPIKIRNEGHEQLLALDDNGRDITLRRAVRDDGGSCPKIRGSKYQQEYKTMAMWVAHCTSEDYAVYVAPSGTVQARPCKDAAQLGLPACKPWPADPTKPGADPPLWPDVTVPPPTNSKALAQ